MNNLFQIMRNNQIKRFKNNKALVSTIQLPIPHGEQEYETLVVSEDGEKIYRYNTFELAIRGHEKHVAFFTDGWWLRHEAEYGLRRQREYDSITIDGSPLWWSEERRRWGSLEGTCSSHKEKVRTLKAFQSHLRSHPELRGHKVRLVSSYKDCDIIATWVKPIQQQGRNNA